MDLCHWGWGGGGGGYHPEYWTTTSCTVVNNVSLKFFLEIHLFSSILYTING